MQKMGFRFKIILSILLIGFSFSPVWIDLQDNEKSLAQEFQTELHKKEHQLSAELARLQRHHQKGDLSQLTNTHRSLYEEDGLSFFIFQNNNLEYWTEDASAIGDYSLASLEEGLVRTENAWQELIKLKANDTLYLGLILIKNEYPYENRFLRNDFQQDLQLNALQSITDSLDQNIVQNSKGKPLLSLQFRANPQLSTFQKILFSAAFLIGLLLLVYLLTKSQERGLKKYFGGSIALIFILRLVLFNQLPANWSDSILFQSADYGISEWIPTLGDLVLHVLMLFFFVYLWKVYASNKKGILTGLLELAFGVTFFAGNIWLIGASVSHSTLNFNLNNLFNLNWESYLCIAAFAINFFTALLLLDCGIKRLSNSLKWLRKVLNGLNGIGGALTLLLIISAITTYVVRQSNFTKSISKQEFILKKLAEEKDPIAEYLFADMQNELIADKELKSRLKIYEEEPENLTQYLKDHFFNGYWDKYELLFTPCKAQDSLYLTTGNTVAACKDYFMDRLRREGNQISSNNLFQLQNFPGRIEYLAEIDIPVDSQLYTLYIELSSNYLTQGQGYPELLLDSKSKADDIDLSDYSYAIYEDNDLMYHQGPYNYPNKLNVENASNSEFIRFQQEEYWNLAYPKDQQTILVLSKAKPMPIDWLTAWAYIFVLYALLFALAALVLPQFLYYFYNHLTDFSAKLQLFLVGSLLLALLAFSWGTFYFIEAQYQKKNFKNLEEKVRSINMELEQKIGTEEILAQPLEPYVTGILIKFSNVFYTDINLYDTEGQLYSSSRPEVFDQKLKSKRMHPLAYKGLVKNQKSEWVQEEQIGDMKYLSAYIPFRNYNNEVLAYLNLPYFAKQDEFQAELSSFLISTLNIYVGIFSLALLLSVLLVNQLSKPLLLIRKQIGRLKIGSSVELIDWDSQDEIGALVKEYNRIAVELNESAEQLAQSEREGAWREMAKQVAHEIKNPLTPMKLSIQHLQRTASSSPEELEKQLKRTTATLIEQIDTLSNIANAFSTFAKLPEKEYHEVDLIPILNSAVHLYDHETPIEVFIPEGVNQAMVKGDKDQLLRLFNNLIKNAVHATSELENGKVQLRFEIIESQFKIGIKDNGTGIPENLKSRIFEPNFTTKSAGTGLGLAMVKSIIDQMEGEISFESEEGKGSEFWVLLNRL